MKQYNNVYFDIINRCNAICPFCITGKNKPQIKHSIEPDIFRQTLQKLIESKAITRSSVIHLYNWGEPFLHPKLSELIGILNCMNLQFGLSTNGSIDYVFPDNFFQNLAYLKFSLPGFSQDSYDKIHKLNFERVISNIIRMIKLVKMNNPKTYIEIGFHIYQFNLEEIETCRNFTHNQKVHFNPYFAILNDWLVLNKYVQKSLSFQEMSEIAEKLFMHKFNELRDKSPSSYICPQYDLLVIDELANVIVCCQLPKDKKEYQCGNILTDEWKTIEKNKISKPVCTDCLDNGLAYYINNSMISPEIFNEKFNEISLTKTKILRLFFNRLKREALGK